MLQPLVVIIAGSPADTNHCQKLCQAVKAFELEPIVRIASAHKTAEHAMALLQYYEADPRSKVYITVAGRSNALSGFVDGLVSAPVIACPPLSESFAGLDILSSLRMPSAIAVAVVLEPENAALLAAKLFAVACPERQKQVRQWQQRQRTLILAADNELQSKSIDGSPT